MPTTPFTGRARRRKTSRLVAWSDRIARFLITLGGAGTILAVGTVCLFLVWVVVPLFLPARVLPVGGCVLDAARPGARPLALRVDEYGILGWSMDRDGTIDVFRADTGKLLGRTRPLGETAPTAAAFAFAEGRALFGFADGKVRFASAGFRTTFLGEAEITPALKSLAAGGLAEHSGGLVERTPEGQLRLQTPRLEPEDPFDLGEGRAVRLLDFTARGSAPRVAALTADGRLRFREVSRTKNLFTGKVRTEAFGGSIDLPGFVEHGPPDHLLLSGVGTQGFAVWKDGRCVRIDLRDIEKPAIAETVDLLGDPSRTVTSAGFLIGKTTLVVGDSGGRIRTWYTVRAPGTTSSDGSTLMASHVLEGPAAAVTCTAPSERTRLLVAGYADGSVRLFHVTSDRMLAEARLEGGTPVEALTLYPKEDGILAGGSGRIDRWRVDAPHPETTASTIFGEVLYEGAQEPEHVWQSSSGTDDFEPKFGLMPLVFGTLKATLYSMFFAVPIALLAAISTSEFLRPESRARVKPTIELMASLPSVVLGFLAALVLAPWIEPRIPAFIAALGAVPFALLAGAHAWQALPRSVAARRERWRLPAAGAAVLLGLLLASLLSGPVESILFAGDVKSWLDRGRGDGRGGWFLILLPFCALGAFLLRPKGRSAAGAGARGADARRAALRFLGLSAAAVAGAWLLAVALAMLGFDPRSGLFGTYVQRNALVVGFVMGFAVIPIIYTLAEDALTSVPEHLRAASLALGATRWQTAVSVIVPTAASGLFSACMIGLGRAVGETMIVLMAAGNTPVMEWNVFNGFRTLSANIAVELPEAVQNGTNYRVLFLAALCLFALTFVLNTAAEIVRQRFRKRAFEL